MFIKNISPSKIKIYGDCPFKFKRKYIEKLPELFNPNVSKNAMQFGLYIHKIFELGWEKETVEELYDIAEQERDKYAFTGYPDTKIRKCIKNFFAFNKTLGKTKGVEKNFIVEWNELELTGIIDRVIIGEEGGVLIIDYKTSKRAATTADLYQDPQMLMYAFAAHHLYKVPYEKIVLSHYYPNLDKLVHVKIPRAVVERYIKGKLMNQIWEIRRKKKNEFPPHHNKFCDWCGFRDICPNFAGETQIKILLEQNEAEIKEHQKKSKAWYDNKDKLNIERIKV